MQLKKLVLLILTISSLFSWEYYYQGQLKPLEPLFSATRNLSNILYFRTQNGIRLGVDHRIVFRPKSDICTKKLLRKYPYHFKKLKKAIVLFVKNPKEVFDIANAIYESGCVVYSHPDFLITPSVRRFDPLFDSQQWNLYNYGQFYSEPDIDINAYEAWLYSKGQGVTVALIDDSYDVDHKDLQNAFIGGYDIIYQTPNIRPDNGYEFHGTLCAGIIGARQNGIGVIGVAPESKLYGIKLLVSDSEGNPIPLYTSDIVKAFWRARNADVINCSWGTYNVADNVQKTIEDLAKNGRNGKGIPIVFASGNDGMPQYYWEYDESALESVIAVGAVTNLGEHPWYSNYGPYLDFVAPSGGGTLAISTTDLQGSAGLAKGYYGHPDYTYANDITGFNGTSAAAPQVTGTIALMLARDPELTKDQIVKILQKTAKKVGNVPYYNGHNDYFGYGLVDAQAAIEEVIRQKTLQQILGNSYLIHGYFIHYDQGIYDWIYVSSSLDFVAKLEGMDKQKYLKWKKLKFTFIQKKGQVIRFFQSADDNPLSLKLSQRSFFIDGYFIHFDLGSYDWIYIPSSLRTAYKLEGLDYKNNFLWVDLKVNITKKNNFIVF